MTGGIGNDPVEGAIAPSGIVGKAIILDTNSLMAPFQFGFNLDLELNRAMSEAEPIVPACVIRELRALSLKGDRHARAALKLSSNYRIVGVKGKGDAPIFNLALNRGWAVMTLDSRLRRKLLSRGISVIILRGKGHLQVQEP